MYSCAAASSSSFFGAASAASSTASAAASADGRGGLGDGFDRLLDGGGGDRGGLFGGGGDVGLGAGVQCEHRGEGREQGAVERFHGLGVEVWVRRAARAAENARDSISRLPAPSTGNLSRARRAKDPCPRGVVLVQSPA